MKKIVLLILTIVSFGIEGNAQKSFYDALAELEGVKFENRHSCSKIEGKEGHYRPGTIYEKNGVVTFQIDRLSSGSPYGFKSFNEEGKRNSFWQSQLNVDYEVDHHVYPSYHKYKGGRDVYVVVDSMIIELKRISSDGLSYDGIGGIYLPVMEEVSEDKPKKKLSMKEKIAAAKDVLKNGSGGSPTMKKMGAKNLDAIITNYLKEMKAKQAACDPALEKKMTDEIEKAKKMDLAEIDAYNDSLYNTPEYQRMRENKARIARAEGNSQGDGAVGNTYKIVNNSGSIINVGSNGHTYNIKPGSSENFSCNTDTYYSTLVGTTWKLGALITKGGDACGKTISID